MYEVLLERSAERDLRKLQRSEFVRVIPQIQALAQQARPHGCKKITGSRSDWRIRIGDLRVLYEIDEGHKAVRVMRVRHRRDAYK